MNWKSTAVVTISTALVGWLASPHPRTLEPTVVAQPARAAQPSSISEIEQQAARLQARLRAESTFREPSRDPFRFEERRTQDTRPRLSVQDIPESREIAPVSRPPLFTLSGLATDVVDGVTQRTAILSAPDGVVLVREGETVGGLFQVAKIEDESVDLVRVADGEVLHLRLTGAKP